MNAFARTEHGLFKVYRQGDDWQVIGPAFERWFSVWRSDIFASLMRALDAVPGVNRQVEIMRLDA